MSHPLANPYTVSLQARFASAYTTLHAIDDTQHHYRLLYIDDDNSKFMKQVVLQLPAYTELVAVPGLVSAEKPWLLTGTTIVSLENLSLRNGLPLPF